MDIIFIEATILIVVQFLREEFMGYLDEWSKSVSERKGFSPKELNNMKLSRETLLGIRVTGIRIATFLSL